MNAIQINKQNLNSILTNLDKLKNQDIDCVEINLFDFVALPFPNYFPDDTVSKTFEIERRKIDLIIENFSSIDLKHLCEKLHSMNIKVLARIINNEYLGNELYSYMQRAIITYNNRNSLEKTTFNNEEQYEYSRILNEYSIFNVIEKNLYWEILKEQVIEWFKNANGDKNSLNYIFSKFKQSIFEQENFEELKQNLISLMRQYSVDGFIFADDKEQNQSILCEELKTFISTNSLLGYQEVRKSFYEVAYIPTYDLQKGYIKIEEDSTIKEKVLKIKQNF